jgi:hypothetical protein
MCDEPKLVEQKADVDVYASWRQYETEMNRALVADDFTERVWSGIVDKGAWVEGDWTVEADAVVWPARTPPHYRCLVTRSPWLGHLCGYVALPPGDPGHGQPQAFFDAIDVHGGVTYAEPFDGFWLVGFHCGNRQDVQPMIEAAVRRHGLHWPKHAMDSIFRRTYRTLPFVREQVESLAEQLARIGGVT